MLKHLFQEQVRNSIPMPLYLRIMLNSGYNSVPRGFGNFWKAIETDTASICDLESFGKGMFVKMDMEKF